MTFGTLRDMPTPLAVRTALVTFLMAGVCHAQPGLESGFKSPPDEARPHTWWHWMNGNVTRAGITADLEAMKRVGLGGAQIFNVSENIPEGPIVYNSPEWRSLVKFASDEARRLGLELCIHDCAGWSSSGGPWVTPENAMQTVVAATTTAPGGGKVSLTLPQPRTSHNYYRDIAVIAYTTPKATTRIADIQVKAMAEYRYGLQPVMGTLSEDSAAMRKEMIDLTSKVTDGKLEWDAPTSRTGEWTIIRLGSTPTGAVNAPSPASGRGLEVDKMSKSAFDAFWAGGMAPLLKELGRDSALKNVLIDSYEVGSQNWTPAFREEFTKRRGYDPLLYLPALTGQIVDSGEVSERFLWDFRRTVGDLFRDNYYSHFSEVCKQNGVLSSTEPYDGPFACTEVSKDADIVMGEFWINADANGGGMATSCKLASSVAHTHGQKIVGAEAFTAFPEIGRWTNTPATLKGIGDLMYTMGINRYIIHRYAHQPWANVEPGMTMGQWGTHFERTTTWWNQGEAWLDYLARCQYMLQQGRFVADVCYFAGDTSPNNWPFAADLKVAGYDYDVCGADVLAGMAVKDGKIVLPNGMSYSLLVLPDTTFMLPATARKVRELANAGATIVGPKPTSSPSLSGMGKGDLEVRMIASDVWGESGTPEGSRTFGTGKVMWGTTPLDALRSLKRPSDASFYIDATSPPAPAPGIAWIHRSVGDSEVYFISNQKPYAQRHVNALFRVAGKQPSFWHADTGTIEPAAEWSVLPGPWGESTAIAISFEARESVFVVFSPQTSGSGSVSAFRFGTSGEEPKPPVVRITKAVYEAVDGAGAAEVTAKLSAIVLSGETNISASNSLFGDPAFNHVKRLRVEYTLNGEKKEAVVPENASLELYADPRRDSPRSHVLRTTASGVEVVAFQPGKARFIATAEQTTPPGGVEIASVPAPVSITGPWFVAFQPHRGAPESITLDQLVSLSKHSDAGVRHFSGTAEYATEFTLPAGTLAADHSCWLHLGGVRDIAEVTLNGKPVGGSGGIWWYAPFESDVTAGLVEGKNTLSVKVTNTWANRLIGDEQLPEDYEWVGKGAHDVGPIKSWPAWLDPASPTPLAKRPVRERITFTTWHHYFKDSPLPESGLLGPVQIRIGVRKPLK